jgi:hypothetical protein
MTDRFARASAWLVMLCAACSPETSTAPGVSLEAALEGAPATITADFSSCGLQPSWFAFRNGDGPWTVPTGSNGVYSLSIVGARASIALVRAFTSAGSTSYEVAIVHFTRSEVPKLIGGPFLGPCGPFRFRPVRVLVNYFGPEIVYGSLGRSVLGRTFGGLMVLLVRGSSGHFLASIADPQTGIPGRYFIERNVDIGSIPDNGLLPFTADFQGPGSFDPTIVPASVAGLGNEPNVVQSAYLTDCRANFLSLANVSGPPVGGTFSVYGVPTARRLENERYFVSVAANDGAIFRTHGRVFNPSATPSVTLPPVLEPEVKELVAPYLRLGFSYTRTFARSASYIQYITPNASHLISLLATPKYLTGERVSLSVPDFSSLPGWDNAWAPPAGTQVPFAVQDLSFANFVVEAEICAERKQSARVGSWAGGVTVNRVGPSRARVRPDQLLARQPFSPISDPGS